MPGDITISFDGQGLDDVMRLLRALPDQVQTRILNRVLNNVATFARSNAVRQVNAEINLSQASIRRFTSITRSNFSSLQSRVTITGEPIPLILFRPSMLSNGLSLRVRRTGARERLTESFITNVGSNQNNLHTGIFRRRFNTSTGRRVGRLQIDERFGPSIPAVFQNNGIEITVPASGQRITNEANRQIEAYLRRF